MADRMGERTRAFWTGSTSFIVRCSTPVALDAVEAILVDLPQPSVDSNSTEIHLIAAGLDEYSLEVEGKAHFGPRPLENALAALVTTLNRLSLDAEPDELHLHCAAVTFGTRTALISAPSGTGKTTLTAALLHSGWGYVTDESVAIIPGAKLVRGFPKPLSIKPGGWNVFAEIAGLASEPNDAESRWHHIPASSLGAPIYFEAEPVVIAILRLPWDNLVGAVTVPLAGQMHPADAVVALMNQTLDAGRFGETAIEVLAELAARCTCLSLMVGPLDAMTTTLAQVVQSPVQRLSVRKLDAGVEPVESYQVAPSTRSVMIGERCVVHETNEGTTVALEESATLFWRVMVGDTPPWWSTDNFQNTPLATFAGQLSSLGLLIPAT